MESLPKHPKQAEIKVYTKDYCPYCTAAMNLLTQKGAGYDPIDVGSDPKLFEEMLKRASPRRTVPQIFIDDLGVGGFDDIQALDSQGKLEALLFPNGRE
ncbi:glutaredoxin 3 [bacterium]|nr:glutaredoxin 3 [bacterium]